MSVGRVQCGASELTVNDGETVEVSCSLAYRGRSPASGALWRVTWLRDDDSDEQVPVASLDDDSPTSVRRSHLFIAEHRRRSEAVYHCSVDGRRTAYNDSCTTRLHVLRKAH